MNSTTPIKKLADLTLKVGSGSTPRGGEAVYKVSGTPLIRSMNVHFGGFKSDGLVYLDDQEAAKLDNVVVHDHDVLLNITGASIGRVTTAPKSMAGARVNQHVCIIRPKPDLNPKYLANFFASPVQQARVMNVQVGATRQALTKAMILNWEVPVPAPGEQKEIVAEIEKQFTRLEAGVAALRRVQANLKRYRASVLKAACEGRLVPTEAKIARKEHRQYESAGELIARTPTPPRPNRWNSRSSDVIPGHSALAVGNPQTRLPEGWSWSALVEIAKMESGHTPSRRHPEWWDGDVAWIGIADAREHDGRAIYTTFQNTNLEGIANSASRLLPAGTVCISRTASVGYVVVMGKEMATSQDFVNWIPTSAVTSDWLRVIFSADREALRRFGKGSVHKTIYFPEWLSIHVAIPPLAEQKRIVAEVERRLSVVDQLEAVVTANLQRATRLRQSILQKAFAGELVISKSVGVPDLKVIPTSSDKRKRHFARAVLSAEIVHQLHNEPTFGRVKHQKIFHLCEHIAQLCEIAGQYHREAAGPLDNKLIYANLAELKKQKWYAEIEREPYGHSYRPLEKAGSHQKYLEGYWPDKTATIHKLIDLMRGWKTDRCEIFSTVYAAWNDLLLEGREVTDENILQEVLHHWHPAKQKIPETRWRAAIGWIKSEGFAPVGYGNRTKKRTANA